ncbi:MAG: DUF4139 domain-containing protein, partial [Planctomycetota bacterium]|nr:DUF4139 domain-containing protein [Planctomycetota bacterium]
LPAGVVRVQKADADGRLEFIGQDSISHVPPDEFVDLRIGRSSDVVAEQKCVNIRRLSDTVSEFEEEITVRNHKTEEVSVLVNLLTGYNTELAAVPPGIVPEKQDALSWRAPVKVPPGKDGVTVRFTVRQVRTK